MKLGEACQLFNPSRDQAMFADYDVVEIVLTDENRVARICYRSKEELFTYSVWVRQLPSQLIQTCLAEGIPFSTEHQRSDP